MSFFVGKRLIAYPVLPLPGPIKKAVGRTRG